jgi:hypothetical protein
MRRYGFLLIVGTLVSACSSSVTTPSCDEPQQCVYASQGAPVCHQSCNGDAGSCPSGQACTGASACCTDTPSSECSGPLTLVCCPASGC